jgi:hypothetical protein
VTDGIAFFGYLTLGAMIIFLNTHNYTFNLADTFAAVNVFKKCYYL